MAIVTLTSDLGDQDHYSATLKAALLRLQPGITLVDISHNVPSFNLPAAAFLLRNACFRFPEGSIHLVAVDPDSGTVPVVAMLHKGHYFIAPDNGILHLVKRGEDFEVVTIQRPDLMQIPNNRSFIAHNLLAPVAAFLAGGGKFEELGEKTGMKNLIWGEPTYADNSLRGTIIHIDRFGNAITNIEKNEFLKIKGDRSFQIFIRNLRLQRIMSSYADVPKGEAIAIFGEHGFLEIAQREGSADRYLGIETHNMLTIEFYG